MRRRSSRALLPLVSLLLGLLPACGKRADPLAPHLKTPRPPTGLEVSQIGDEVEIRITAPRTTTENRPLPVIELEWLQSAPTGDFRKLAVPILREEVAPGELRTKRFPRPPSDARFSVRALAGKTKSTPVAPVLFKPAPVPEPPTGLQATNTVTGVLLSWTNPAGAEPWPTPTPTPTPSPTPGTSPQPSLPAPNSMIPGIGPSPSPSEPVLPSPSPSASAQPSPVPPDDKPAAAGSVKAAPAAGPSPAPTPPPLLAGIRIFRTDGLPGLARAPLQASSWLDAGAKPGEKRCYSVRYAASFKPLVESAATEPACVDIKDIVPPEPPGRLLGDIGPTFVELSWVASVSDDVEFYRIYRSLGESPRTLGLETQGPVLRIRDPNMAGGPRTYDIVAVDKGGNESASGPMLKIIVP